MTATIDDLRSIVASSGLNPETGPGGELLLCVGRFRFLVSAEDLQAYLDIRERVRLGPETALFAPGHYEQLIEVRVSRFAPPRLFMNRDEDAITLTRQDGTVKIEIGPPSALFALAVADKSTQDQWRTIRRYVVRPFRPGDDGNGRPLRELFGRAMTIRVNAPAETPSSPEAMHTLAHSALFNISFARGAALNLLKSWERSLFRLEGRRERAVSFPVRKYKGDLVAYYQLALSSESLILAYLSLYKIVEFFYVTTAERVLHKRLADRLAIPTFSATRARDLREVADIVRRFDKKMNEQQMLTNVLTHFLMPDEIRAWVTDFESESGQYFTEPQEILGETLTLNLDEHHVFSSLSQRIYHIRNALVHNKDGDLPRFVPFSGQEEVLTKEAPLLLSIAEQIIVKSGEDLA